VSDILFGSYTLWSCRGVPRTSASVLAQAQAAVHWPGIGGRIGIGRLSTSERG